MRCEQLTHSATRVKGVHQPRPGAVVVPPAGGGGRWPYHPPWTPAGKGSKGWEHRATEAVLSERTSQGGNPEEGSESSVRDKQRDRVALWTYGERERFLHCGSTLPPPETERCAVPSPSRPPTQPRLPPPPCATRVSAKGGAQAGQEPSTRCLAPEQMGTSASLHARMDGGGSSEQAGKTIDTGKVRRCR